MDAVVTAIRDLWGDSEIGKLTFDRWLVAFHGFVEQPVAVGVGPAAPTDPYIDALADVAPPVVPDAAAIDDEALAGYEHQGGPCGDCGPLQDEYTPPTEFGDGQEFNKMELKPMLLTATVCQHCAKQMYNIKGAAPGTYDVSTRVRASAFVSE